MISFDVLINAPTEDSIYNGLIGKIVSVGIPADKWNKRGVGIAIIRGFASTGAGIAALITSGIKGTFVGRDATGALLATGPFLTVRARYDFGVERTEATFAEGTLLVSNTGANVYTFQPGTFQVRNHFTKKAYVNVDVVDLNPGDTDIAFDMIAVEQGSGSNAAPGEIGGPDSSDLVSPADTKITFTNPAAFVATDEQGDDDLTDACTQKIGSWSLLGPRDAYYTAIRNAVRDDNGLPVNVNRKQRVLVDSKGQITLYLASPSGPVDSHDIAGVKASVELIARPDTVKVNVLSSSGVPTTGTLTVWARALPGVTADLISSAVNAMLEKEIEAYEIGGVKTSNPAQGYLYAKSIEEWGAAAHPAIIKADFSGADVPLSDGQVAELTATLDIRLVQVA